MRRPSVRGELLCFNYHHLYGLQHLSCLRFFTVYGPAQRPEMAIHKFTDLIASRRADSDVRQRREPSRLHLHRRHRRPASSLRYDLAPGFEIFNLGGAETTRLRIDSSMAGSAELAVEASKIEYLPDQPGDVPITYADVTKAERGSSATRRKVPIDEGMTSIRRLVYRETTEW